jgi:hypothetical protein
LEKGDNDKKRKELQNDKTIALSSTKRLLIKEVAHFIIVCTG